MAAHAETSRPDLLYVIGRLHAERKACRLAIEHFTRFLESKPGPRAAEAAQAEVDACQAILDAEHARAAAVTAPPRRAVTTSGVRPRAARSPCRQRTPGPAASIATSSACRWWAPASSPRSRRSCSTPRARRPVR
ncbi:MAG: hypothetical protein HS111_24530 [Kofleriaceae bacterium]|nr:hypothetical protein [Kofleriaceae bacterium]